jgi:hypothetical protein
MYNVTEEAACDLSASRPRRYNNRIPGFGPRDGHSCTFPIRDCACGGAIRAVSKSDDIRLKGTSNRKEGPRNVPEGYDVLGCQCESEAACSVVDDVLVCCVSKGFMA